MARSSKEKNSKPAKPYPAFPLTAHPNGQWCKKIRGKVHFFGVWADSEAALNRFLSEQDDLFAGRPVDRSQIGGTDCNLADLSPVVALRFGD